MIDKEDVHDRSKWRRNVNVMKRKSNPIGKRTINRYIPEIYVLKLNQSYLLFRIKQGGYDEVLC